MKTDIVIFSSKVARDLIRNKFEINDIKQNKECPLKTVFYFENTKQLKDYLKEKHNIEIK